MVIHVEQKVKEFKVFSITIKTFSNNFNIIRIPKRGKNI